MTLKTEILQLLRERAGLTDREITNILRSPSDPQQPVNIACRRLAEERLILRKKRHDNLIGNYLNESSLAGKVTGPIVMDTARPSGGSHQSPGKNPKITEDDVKEALRIWLEAQGWQCKIAWGSERGIDIEATRLNERWVIEAKGEGKYDPMSHNYFLGVLGTLLLKMDNAASRYSVALPDVQKFRRLWATVPAVALERTRISALFVGSTGGVELVDPSER